MKKVLGAVFSLLIFSAAMMGQTDKTVSTIDLLIVDQVTHNNCTGEDVIYNGDVQSVTTSFHDANGALHIRMHLQNANIAGTGVTTGASYTLKESGSDVEVTAESSAPAETTNISRLRVLGAAALPNEIIQIGVHFTINANGILTADVEQFMDKCTGK